jgi:glutaredoxin 3
LPKLPHETAPGLSARAGGSRLRSGRSAARALLERLQLAVPLGRHALEALGGQIAPATLSEVMHRITVYSTEPCSFCARVKGLLTARGVVYAEVNLSKDPAGRVELARKTGMMSFPQVLIDDQLLGGYAELQAAVEDGRLDELLVA